MKRKARFIFLYCALFVYVISVIGVTINKHFCEGELEAITLIEKSSCCEGETADEPDDCCSNETIYLANTTETINNSVKLNFDSGIFALYLNELINTISFNETKLPIFVSSEIKGKPPLIDKEDAPKLMVFRI